MSDSTTTTTSSGIYDHSCVRCNKLLVSDRVVVESVALSQIQTQNNKKTKSKTETETETVSNKEDPLQHLCEDCFLQERYALRTSYRNKKPILAMACDLCGADRNGSRYYQDMMLHVCDRCQEENDRLDEDTQNRLFATPASEMNVGKFQLPHEIVEGKIFLGSKLSSLYDGILINDMNVRQIIVCCAFLPTYFRNNENLSEFAINSLAASNEQDNGSTGFDCNRYGIRYLRLPLQDNLDQDLMPFLDAAIEFIDEGYEKYKCATLVHCHAGVSRSAAVVIAWLMRHNKLDYDAAHKLVKEKRKVISPNSNFVNQLRTFS